MTLTPAACTRTRASPSAGSGTGSSRTEPALPKLSTANARIGQADPLGQIVDCATFSRRAARCNSAHDALADLDQMTVRVADIRANLAAVILGLGEELGPLGRPLLVDLLDVA